MHDIPDPTRLCTQQVKSSVSISSVVQDLKILQLHSGNSEVVKGAYADALDLNDSSVGTSFASRFESQEPALALLGHGKCNKGQDKLCRK